jgi:hypothetical protein
MKDEETLLRAMAEARKGKRVIVVVASMFEAIDYKRELIDNYDAKEGARIDSVQLRIGAMFFVSSSGGHLPERIAGLSGPVFITEPARRLEPAEYVALLGVDPEFPKRFGDD